MRIGSLRSPHIVVAASMIKDPAPCRWLLRPSGRVARQHFRINEVTRTVSRCRREAPAFSDVDQRFFLAPFDRRRGGGVDPVAFVTRQCDRPSPTPGPTPGPAAGPGACFDSAEPPGDGAKAFRRGQEGGADAQSPAGGSGGEAPCLRPDDRPKPAQPRGDRKAERPWPDDKNSGVKRGKLPSRLGRATSAHYAYAPIPL
jgi:hypothetical protein